MNRRVRKKQDIAARINIVQNKLKNKNLSKEEIEDFNKQLRTLRAQRNRV